MDKRSIVQTALFYLHEKINVRLRATYDGYSFLYLAISKLDKDKEVVKPTYENWVQRIDKMKTIKLTCKFDHKRSALIPPTARMVKSLINFPILPEHIGARMIELQRGFDTLKETLLPSILDEDKKIKTYQIWHDEAL